MVLIRKEVSCLCEGAVDDEIEAEEIERKKTSIFFPYLKRKYFENVYTLKINSCY